jgi:hypothetical protein
MAMPVFAGSQINQFQIVRDDCSRKITLVRIFIDGATVRCIEAYLWSWAQGRRQLVNSGSSRAVPFIERLTQSSSSRDSLHSRIGTFLISKNPARLRGPEAKVCEVAGET